MDGEDFSVMGMHFKLGLYEHQSAGAIEGVLKLIQSNSFLEHNNPDCIKKMKIVAYEPAFGIIGDPAKRNPTTRQSADHSMVYIISKIIKKALANADVCAGKYKSLDEIWKVLMLTPNDYSHAELFDETTRKIMSKIEFEHGGKDYDQKYPEGIPTSVQITTSHGNVIDSGFVMFPSGHSG
jgi:2-methylcitrate dehydratase